MLAGLAGIVAGTVGLNNGCNKPGQTVQVRADDPYLRLYETADPDYMSEFEKVFVSRFNESATDEGLDKIISGFTFIDRSNLSEKDKLFLFRVSLQYLHDNSDPEMASPEAKYFIENFDPKKANEKERSIIGQLGYIRFDDPLNYSRRDRAFLYEAGFLYVLSENVIKP